MEVSPRCLFDCSAFIAIIILATNFRSVFIVSAFDGSNNFRSHLNPTNPIAQFTILILYLPAAVVAAAAAAARFQDQQRSWASRRWKARSFIAIRRGQWMHDGFRKQNPSRKTRVQNFIYETSSNETRMRTRTRTEFLLIFLLMLQCSCWCCYCCCCCSLVWYYENWAKHFSTGLRRRQRHKIQNKSGIFLFYFSSSYFFFFWTVDRACIISVNPGPVAVVCLNIIETRFQWVNLELAMALQEGPSGCDGRLRKHN